MAGLPPTTGDHPSTWGWGRIFRGIFVCGFHAEQNGNPRKRIGTADEQDWRRSRWNWIRARWIGQGKWLRI